jgi:hypothetical protein
LVSGFAVERKSDELIRRSVFLAEGGRVVDQQFLKPLSPQDRLNSSTICFWLPLRKSEYANFGGALTATDEEKFAARQSMALFMGGKDSLSYTKTVMIDQGISPASN